MQGDMVRTSGDDASFVWELLMVKHTHLEQESQGGRRRGRSEGHSCVCRDRPRQTIYRQAR
jgi:hypothetical protein